MPSMGERANIVQIDEIVEVTPTLLNCTLSYLPPVILI